MNTRNLSATVSQLINCAPERAFDAFVEPSVITKFWLESASAPLSKAGQAIWRFMVPGAVDTVKVNELERPSLIALSWSDESTLRLEFAKHSESKTQVSAEFSIAASDSVDQIVDTAAGYTIVLCDLKTLLESGNSANLVRSKAELITCSMAPPQEIGRAHV